jgi:hypothetical protein
MVGRVFFFNARLAPAAYRSQPALIGSFPIFINCSPRARDRVLLAAKEIFGVEDFCITRARTHALVILVTRMFRKKGIVVQKQPHNPTAGVNVGATGVQRGRSGGLVLGIATYDVPLFCHLPPICSASACQYPGLSADGCASTAPLKSTPK